VTDRDLVAKKLARIVTCLHELRTLASVDRLREDVREERFVEHTLQIAIQSALDVASHIASDQRLGEPETNRALFQLLARAEVISKDHAQRLAEMAGFAVKPTRDWPISGTFRSAWTPAFAGVTG